MDARHSLLYGERDAVPDNLAGELERTDNYRL